jgi:queuine tRNA-ribosyltransferase
VRFEVIARSGRARLGRLSTPHGEVQTPAFMPVGTAGSVKALHPAEVSQTGARLLIANTYHLWLRPGAELVAELGGLHTLMRWPHAIATDSGGFQAFSLAQRVRVDESGFEFSSHIDGSRRRLTPEESMRVQGLLGSDIALQLDICPPAGVARPELLAAVERTTRWAERCLAARKPGQALFGIVQGGTDIELRCQHAETLARLPLDGLALGGFSVGEPPDLMHQALEQVVPGMDATRPRYLMGVGTPLDLVRAVSVGVDLFDCVMPTRNARNGQAFVGGGRLTVKNARFRADARPLDEACDCPVCSQGFSRAYLRHLYMAGEILGHRLISLHNLHHYASLMASARKAISEGQLERWVHVTSQQVAGGRDFEGS